LEALISGEGSLFGNSDILATWEVSTNQNIEATQLNRVENIISAFYNFKSIIICNPSPYQTGHIHINGGTVKSKSILNNNVQYTNDPQSIITFICVYNMSA
jgi:hypothetical protein